jgi:hypothetical protein
MVIEAQFKEKSIFFYENVDLVINGLHLCIQQFVYYLTSFNKRKKSS